MTLRTRDDQTAPRDPMAGFGPTRVFRAPSMREAFVAVKAAIGSEAVILTTRDCGPGNDEQRFEVVAAWPSAAAAPAPSPAPRTQREATIPDALRMPRPADEAPRGLATQLQQLEQAVRSLESQIQMLADKDRRM